MPFLGQIEAAYLEDLIVSVGQCLLPLLAAVDIAVHLDLYCRSILTLVAIFFNSLGFLLLLFSEVLTLGTKSSTNRDGVISDINPLKLPLLDQNPEEAQPGLDSLIFRFLYWISLPLVIASFIPQVLTLVGIPHTIACIRRFMSEGSSPSRVETRGLFLLPLNTVSFFVVMCVLLPGISLVGMLLSLYNKVQFFFTGEKSKLFGGFRQAIQFLLALLSFCYRIFLEKPPVIRFEKMSNVDFSGWKAVAVVLWFVTFEIGLAIYDVVTDFLFANQLLTLSQDLILTDRGIVCVEHSVVCVLELDFFAGE